MNQKITQATALVGIVFASLSNPASAAPTSTELVALGSASSIESFPSEAVATINEVKRSEEGSLVSFTWTVTNRGSRQVDFTEFTERTYDFPGVAVDGIKASSPESGSIFYPVRDSTLSCVCSAETKSPELTELIDPDRQATYWGLFSIPQEIERINISIPGFEEIENIPIP